MQKPRDNAWNRAPTDVRTPQVTVCPCGLVAGLGIAEPACRKGRLRLKRQAIRKPNKQTKKRSKAARSF